ncbi:MAG: CBS domain-containing protein, partial [Candidatus Dadabacteria bacterium]|nr:CBS domain-containing protein [Candidatus Dadabacteria bacterium]NIT13098.1 CBS domain-containing protein [Candidatus Dadabacteria bacterium]
MFGKQIKLFSILGFDVSIDTSWLILAFLITWTLAQAYFPHYYKDFSAMTYWYMGACGAIGLFISIIFHELSHSLVARNYGIPMKGITLFIFGGVARMEDEPPSPKSEFLMAIAGPISSIFLAIFFYVISIYTKTTGLPGPVTAVFSYLAFINTVLAVFNMLPGFPLDGGRVLRSVLWYWKNNIKWATKIASQIGTGLGTLFIILGFVSIITGNFIGGLWWALIGIFLRNASSMSYQHLALRNAFKGEKVRRFMNPDPITINSSVTIQDLVENYFYHYHYKMFPVLDNSNLLGCVTTRNVKNIPKKDWDVITVKDITTKCTPDNTIDVNTDALKALMLMNNTGNSRL